MAIDRVSRDRHKQLEINFEISKKKLDVIDRKTYTENMKDSIDMKEEKGNEHSG